VRNLDVTVPLYFREWILQSKQKEKAKENLKNAQSDLCCRGKSAKWYPV